MARGEDGGVSEAERKSGVSRPGDDLVPTHSRAQDAPLFNPRMMSPYGGSMRAGHVILQILVRPRSATSCARTGARGRNAHFVRRTTNSGEGAAKPAVTA